MDLQGNLEQSQEMLLKQSISLQQIQYLKLLAMNVTELDQYLYSVYEENPVVELSSSDNIESASDFFSWLNQSSTSEDSQATSDDDAPSEVTSANQILDEKKNLLSHLKNQFDFSLREIDISLLNILLSSLDKKGYLTITEEEIIQKGYDAELVCEAISYLQSLEPAGIGARNLAECLAIQLKRKGVQDPVYFDIVNQYLEDVSKGYFQKVAKTLGCEVKKIRDIYEEIKHLNPIPASGFGNDPSFSCIIPDVTVTKNRNGELSIQYNKNFESKISINQRYIDLGSEDKEAENYIKEKAAQALWVMKSIHSRQKTIENVVSAIVRTQQEFFLNHSPLKPLTLNDIANELSIHESTVSRTVSGKFLECKQGVFPLKYFFTGKVSQVNDAIESSLSITNLKNRISAIIAQENPKKPYSDNDIIKILEEEGITIARRTIAKYRSELGIPSSSMRKKY